MGDFIISFPGENPFFFFEKKKKKKSSIMDGILEREKKRGKQPSCTP